MSESACLQLADASPTFLARKSPSLLEKRSLPAEFRFSTTPLFDPLVGRALHPDDRHAPGNCWAP
ncbi:hypothetical protein [Streptomyces xiaopingdaonensis]|uniref:hypothetical protein n=1 Tax=Streptomyces xiaopingdaonensis TaxID=1565415 RepID=UPI000362EB47|nr:hypothetical protein [Streptomyces xiaopingdaonensis]